MVLCMCCVFMCCKPASVTLPQDILSLAEARLSRTSSAAVCRKLSSIGRRVLSIESVSNFQGYHVHHVYLNRSPLSLFHDFSCCYFLSFGIHRWAGELLGGEMAAFQT